MAAQTEYPWFGIVQENALEQGDLLRGCPRFIIPSQSGSQNGRLSGERELVDGIILTQSCDLTIRADGNCEATDVLLAPYYERKTLAVHPNFRKDEFWEEVRKGRRPFFYVLNECRLAGQEQDFALVDFHALFTLSVPLVREFIASAGTRLRLLPPYREHISQAFARLFMRVGLPTDLPPFGKKQK